MLQNWLNPLYLNSVQSLQKLFKTAKPFQHIALADTFDTRKITAVRNALLKEKFENRETDLCSFKEKNLKETNNPVLAEFCNLLNSREFIAYVSALTGTRVKTVEITGYLYEPTDHLLPHDDKVKGRKIAFFLNLTKNVSGGELELFESEKGHAQNITKRILPAFNTLTFFDTSRKSFYQISEVLQGRRITIGGWFHG